MQSLKKYMTCGFKYDMRNLVNFQTRSFTLMGSFDPKFELKKYKGVIFNETEN